VASIPGGPGQHDFVALNFAPGRPKADVRGNEQLVPSLTNPQWSLLIGRAGPSPSTWLLTAHEEYEDEE